MDLIEDRVAYCTSPVNLLKHNRKYEELGSTAVVAAEPAVVDFGGFQPGQLLQQVVCLTNISDAATRVQVIPPDTNEFKVIHKRKAGSIAPGLHEQLVVQFSSTHLREHHDCIRVHTEAGGLLIPLHAYPVMNSISLPRRLDFGKVAVGGTFSKQLQLSCKVSLNFDFRVTVVKHNRCFSVAPLVGTVPANGTAAITVTFSPTSMNTEEFLIEVLLSEYNAQPMHVTITGSALPGIARDKLIACAINASTLQQLIETPQQQQQQQQQQRCISSPTRGALGSSEHRGSNNTPGRRSHSTLQRNTLLPAVTSRQQQQGQEVLLEGTYFPATISTQHDINSVLNQQPGKLRTKEIKTAIANRKLELQVEQQQLEAVLAAGAAACVDPFDQPDIPPAIKEALFQLQLQQAEASAKHCTGLVGAQGSALLGQEPPSPDTVKQLQAARQSVLDQYQKDKQEAATHRLELEVQKSGALHVLNQQHPPNNSSSSRQADPDSKQQLVGHGNGVSSSSSSVQQEYLGLQDFQPQWLLLESNEWRKRVQVTQRFVDAVRVVIFRNRARKRLQKLKLLAARLRGNKEAMAGLAVQEIVLEGSVVQRPGCDPTQLLMPEKVRLAELPVYRDSKFCQHTQVEQGAYGDFTLLQQQPYKAEFEWKLLGYTPEDYPGLIPYLPPCTDQPLMTGAGEELLVGLPCGVLPAGLTEQELEAMPEGFMVNPHKRLEIGDRYTNDQVFVPLSPAWGLEAEALLQPRALDHRDSASEEQPGSSGIRSLTATPLRAYRWLPLQDPWQAAPSAVPELMAGPDPSDSGSPAGIDSPQIPINVPNIQSYLAHRHPNENKTAMLTRQLKQQELDACKQQQHIEAVVDVEHSVLEYNGLLKRPHRMAIKL